MTMGMAFIGWLSERLKIELPMVVKRRGAV
jgi:hypothetical protein